jgi:helix-turn-helix protein
MPAEPANGRGFTWIENDVLLDARLSPQSRLLYALLRHHARRKGECWPKLATLTKELGVGSERTARRYVSELEEADLIEGRRRGAGRSKVYALAARSDRTGSSGHNDGDRTTVSGQTGQIFPVMKKSQRKKGTPTRVLKAAAADADALRDLRHAGRAGPDPRPPASSARAAARTARRPGSHDRTFASAMP